MIAYWDGKLCLMWDADGEVVSWPLPQGKDQEDAVDTVMPAGQAPDMLFCAAEHLLMRPFSLPLSHPRLLDEDIMGQELAEQVGIEPASWWLAWRASSVEGGVAGLVFGLSTVFRDSLASDATWRHCPFIGVDIWPRLSALVPVDHGGSFAVFDADTEGLFIGVHRDGAWRGMRRLNLEGGRTCAAVADDARRSVTAMGFSAEAMPAYGRLDAAWHGLLGSGIPDWRGEVVETLPDRVTAIRHAAAGTGVDFGPNFRRGAWAVRSSWSSILHPWRRAMVLASVILLLVTGGNVFLLHQLRARQASLQAGVEAAFHRGLPDEKVMLDPLAQLRKAAGKEGDVDTWFLLRQLEAIGTAKQRITGLHIGGIEYTKAGMKIFGTAPDLAAVNRIRDELSTALGRSVRIVDTELAGKQVRFRLKWS